MTIELQTGRLLLQPLQLPDAGQIQCLFPQWEIVKFLTAKVPWPLPADGVFNYYRNEAQAPDSSCVVPIESGGATTRPAHRIRNFHFNRRRIGTRPQLTCI
jgi:hypothetical protein